jgi:hypothetical protein
MSRVERIFLGVVSLPQKAFEAAGEFWEVAGLAFPDGEDAPAEAAEGAVGTAVAVGVSLDFGGPPFAAGGGDAASAAGVAVPETAAHVNDLSMTGQDNVGGAGEGFDMQAVAEAEAMDQTAHRHFRGGVLRFDGGHDAGALGLGERVHCTEFGSIGAIEDNRRIMTNIQLESLKRHFLEWSGGFEPESMHQIVVYVDYARDRRLDWNEVLEALMTWMGAEN